MLDDAILPAVDYRLPGGLTSVEIEDDDDDQRNVAALLAVSRLSPCEPNRAIMRPNTPARRPGRNTAMPPVNGLKM